MREQKDESQEVEAEKLLNVKTFQEQWSELVDFSSEALEVKESPLEAIAEEIDLPLQTVSDLSTVCSLETLLCGSEPEDKKHYYMKIPETDLKTLHYQGQNVQMRKDSVVYRSSVMKHLKYNINNTTYNPTAQNRGMVKVGKQVPTPNVILTINIHRPYNYKVNNVIVDHTLLVHGDMYLTQFRDCIECINDSAVAGDFSENLAQAQSEPSSLETFRSGFIFIEGTFYNDVRHSDNRDYSKPIIEWLKKSNKCESQYKTASMESVKFSNLSIRLGEPYIYIHQGNCEHLISFTDIRMLMADDPQSIDDYPFNVMKINRRRILCKSCMMYTARWQVEESKYTPVEPCYLCDGCLNSLHYDEQGNKVGHFKAYKFSDSYSVQ